MPSGKSHDKVSVKTYGQSRANDSQRDVTSQTNTDKPQTPHSMASSLVYSDYEGPELLNLSESEHLEESPGPYIVEKGHGPNEEHRVITVAELNEDTAHDLHNKAVQQAVKQAKDRSRTQQT